MRQKLPGQIVLMGTPAEEGGGGKITLLDKGAFDGVDAAMMAHPCDAEYSAAPVLAMEYLRITFHGRAAHAAAAPWMVSAPCRQCCRPSKAWMRRGYIFAIFPASMA